MMTAGLAADKQVVVFDNSSYIFSLSLSLHLQLVMNTEIEMGMLWASIKSVIQVYVAMVALVKF